MVDVNQAPWWPPGVDWKEWRVPPPANSYVRQDDYLAVTVLTATTTTGLALRYRILTSSGQVHDGAETLDGASENTLKTFLFQLTEGFLLSCTVSNIGGGLADNVCGVVMALQKGGHTATAPHTILAQGYVSNIVGVTWPVGLPRGPATPTGLPTGAAAGDLVYFDGSAWKKFAGNAVGNKILQESSSGALSWVAAGGATDSWVSALPDYPPASPNAMDDEFTGASLNTTLWTELNWTTGVAGTQANSRLKFTDNHRATYAVRGITQPIPVGSWEFTACFDPILTKVNAKLAGMLLADDQPKYLFWGHQFNGSYNYDVTPSLSQQGLTAFNDYLFSYFQYARPWRAFRIHFNGTTLTFSGGNDAASLTPFFADTPANLHLTGALTSIGLGIMNYDSGTDGLGMSCDWFRRTA